MVAAADPPTPGVADEVYALATGGAGEGSAAPGRVADGEFLHGRRVDPGGVVEGGAVGEIEGVKWHGSRMKGFTFPPRRRRAPRGGYGYFLRFLAHRPGWAG